MTKSLADIAEAMRDIDFCVLTTRAEDGSIAGRPMSNNREVAYEGIMNGRFRHNAHFRHWRDDKDPEECTMEQLRA